MGMDLEQTWNGSSGRVLFVETIAICYILISLSQNLVKTDCYTPTMHPQKGGDMGRALDLPRW